MSLPAPVLDLAADVVPEAEDHGKLAFAYAHGALLSGFGSDEELELVCVWNHDAVPAGAPERSSHITQRQFDQNLSTVSTGDGWKTKDATPLQDIAGFAYGVLLSDDEGAGTTARGAVGEFPAALAQRSAALLASDLSTVTSALADTSDRWMRADLLSRALHHGYVAWFAASEHYFPGARRRREYARRFGLDTQVLDLEQQVWEADSSSDAANRYRAFVEKVLSDC